MTLKFSPQKAFGPSKIRTWCMECDRLIPKGEYIHFHSKGLKMCWKCFPLMPRTQDTHTDDNERTWHKLECRRDTSCDHCGDEAILVGDMFWWSSNTTGTCCKPAPEPEPLPLSPLAAAWWNA
jgi:hypothetical protein